MEFDEHHLADRPPTRSRRLDNPTGTPAAGVRTLALGSATLLALMVLSALWRERCEFWTCAIAGVALVLLLTSTQWWRTRRVVAATIVLDVVLIFLFLWSLDERVHVSVHVSHGQYVGSTGTASITTPQTPIGTRFGLYVGPLYDLRVSPLGEAQMASPTAPLARFGEWMRLAFAPAWTNVRVIGPGHTQSTFPNRRILTGRWTANRRGEFAGSPFSSIFLGTAPPSDYTIEGDILRGDGTQGILVGIDSSNRGLLFASRMDEPDVQWVHWNNGLESIGLSGSSTILPLRSMVQRDIRLVLTNYMWGIILVMSVVPIYLTLVWLFRFLGGSSEDELLPVDRLLRRHGPMLAVAACIALAATLMTALVASNLLERIPHVQDSVADLFQAKTFALGRLWVPDPHFHAFFSEEFIPVRDGKWFGKYPPGWPLLLAIGVLLHIPWLIDPILSGIVVLLIYLIGREVYGVPVGLLAALLSVSSPFFLFLGGSFMPHTSTVFYLLSAVYLFIRWKTRSNRTGMSPRMEAYYLSSAGLLLGLAFITRQTDTIAFALPFLGFLVPCVRRLQFRPLGWLMLGGFPPVVFLLLYNWVLAGNPLTSPYSLWWPFDRIGFGPTVGAGGFTPAQGLWNTSFNLQMLLAHLFGWPFYFTLALAGVPFLVGRATRWDWTFLGSAVAIIGAYVAYWNPGVMYGPRYYFALVPSAVLLTARGLEELYRWPMRIPIPWNHDRIAALALPATVLALLVTYNLSVYLPAQISIYHGYNYTSAASIDAVQRAGIHHALIFVVSTPATDWWSYGAVFSSNSPLLDGDVVYARDAGAADRELMNAYPGRVYYRLEHATLTRLNA